MTSTTFSWCSRAVLPFALVLGLASAPASAALQTYGFGNITNNNSVNAATGEAQLFVDVTDNGVLAGQTAFTFRNIGLLASSITDIYFDNGTLLGIASIVNGPLGVSFSQGASPGELPGANNATPDFETSDGFLADSDSPTQPNGVNPGEFVTILFNLINGQTIDDVFAALDLGLALNDENDDPTGALRIGIHVQGFANGGSESFINTDCVEGCSDIPGEIPEPESLALIGVGLLGLAATRRRRTV